MSKVQMTQTEFNQICPQKFSVDWNGGGTYGNCWDSTMYTCSGSDPETLTAHLDFLEEHFPACTIGAMRAIQNAVQNTTQSEGDYYGGSTTRYFISISREKIQDVLEDFDILEIIEE